MQKKYQSLWKITKHDSAIIAISLFLFYSFYYDLVDVFPHYFFSFAILIVSSQFALFSMMRDKRIIIKIKHLRYMIGWLVIMVFFLFIRNRWIENGMYWRTVRWCWAILIALCLMQSKDNLDGLFHRMKMVGFPNVLATIFFFVFRNAYSYMYRIWGGWPSGTSFGRYGYKASLTNHYSHNAIMISIVLMIIGAELMYSVYNRTDYNGAKQRKHKQFWLVAEFLLTFFALVLTAKRGHLIFCILSIFIGYLICNVSLSIRKLLRSLLVFAIIVICFYYVYNNIVELHLIVTRMLRIGKDYSSTTRLQMWAAALELFEAHPFIGIGWGGFRYATDFNIEAHNVYFQLLAETGLIGTTIYLITNMRMLMIDISNTRRLMRKKFNNTTFALDSMCALFIQIFYLLYSMTGNCLYDITFDFYAICIGVVFVCASFC